MKLKALVSIGINHEDILPGTIFELTDQDDIERLVRLKAVEVREEAAVIPVPTMPVPPVESGVSEILVAPADASVPELPDMPPIPELPIVPAIPEITGSATITSAPVVVDASVFVPPYQLKKVDSETIEALVKAGYDSLEKLSGVRKEDLISKGFAYNKAKKICEANGTEE